MSLSKNLLIIWKNKNQILEGIKNSVFKREDVEQIAAERFKVCEKCKLFDQSGEGCLVLGTQPCCNEKLGGCGCSLDFKTRSLSSDCPKKYWSAVISEKEEELLNEKLGIN